MKLINLNYHFGSTGGVLYQLKVNNVFLVCIETGHVKRTGVVGDIGGNNSSSDLGQIQPWSGDHSLNSRGFQLHVPSDEFHTQGCRRTYAFRQL